MSLESQLWREVCQHLELEESVQRVFDILAEHVPVVALVIRRLDLDPLDAAQARVRQASEQATSAPEKRGIMATIRARAEANGVATRAATAARARQVLFMAGS